jgi:hypothetical protein
MRIKQVNKLIFQNLLSWGSFFAVTDTSANHPKPPGLNCFFYSHKSGKSAEKAS